MNEIEIEKTIQRTNFSIILPTYNRFKQAIDSVLNQTYKIFELIIINDGSTDKTSSNIEIDYNQQINNGKINLIKLKENKGQCFARNIGLEQAKNEWLVYLDSDNIMFPFFLDEVNQAICKNTNLTYYAKRL